ncbi:MAG: SBBP repeat-containing protein, partial [Acidobacteriota bacterium]
MLQEFQAQSWRRAGSAVLTRRYDRSPGGVARTIHQLSAAAPLSSALTALPTLGLLDVVHGYASGDLVTRFAPDGSVVFSTLLGGSDCDIPQGIALDPANNIYLTGWTNSEDFPTVNPVQPQL